MPGSNPQYEKDFAALNGGASKRFRRLREEAFERFRSLGFPTTDQEAWKYTSVEPVVATPFRLLPSASHAVPPVGELPKGLFIGPLSEGLRLHPEIADRHLGRIVPFRDRPFAALNTAFLQDGLLVYLPKGVLLKEPIHLVYETKGDLPPTVSYPRNLIVAEEGSHAAIIETYRGGHGPYFTNAMTEVALGEGSVLDHYKIEEEGREANHIAEMGVRQGRDSRFTSHNVSFGAALCRNNLETVLEAEGAECVLNGLYLATGRQHIDNHTSIDHARPHGTSQELYKGILDGGASGVFDGRIVVRADAQKTNARQTNKNLLLSDRAVVNTRPLLEILANDVKCNHGATIGRLDENQIFYLRSRGLGEKEARALLIWAFAGEIVAKMQIPSLRSRLQGMIFSGMAGGHLAPIGGGL